MNQAPLAGLVLWVTRPEPENERSAEFWRAQGADASCVPFLSVVPIEVSAEEIRRVEDATPGHVVFTSARAVERLVASLDSRTELLDSLRGRPSWTVGDKTRGAAVAAGFRDLRDNPGRSARDLAEHMKSQMETQETVLFAAARQRRPELPELLRAAGISVVEWTVYDTVAVAPPDARWRELRGPRPPLLLLYSPTAVKAVVEALGEMDARELVVATLGESTRLSAREHGFSVVVSASSPTEESLRDALRPWWAQRRTRA